MRRCVSCEALYPLDAPACTECGAAPGEVEGFEAHAPQRARQGGGFDPVSFQDLARLEATNFWFRARNRLILDLLRRHAGDMQNFLEVGCGTGFVLSAIAERFPDTQVFGSEIFVEGLKFAQERVPGATLMQMDGRAIPFQEAFDAVGAFDVLEHIPEDAATLQQMRAALRPNGVAVFTVPQHPWLWSQADTYAHHQRRYSRGELERKAKEAGFEILLSTSFVATLMPAMLVSRMLSRNAETYDPKAEMSLNPILNKVFERMLDAERWSIARGVTWPTGGSRVVVARADA